MRHALTLLAAATLCACGDATISGPSVTPNQTSITVQFDLTFKRVPKGCADAKDVSVVLDSKALEAPQSFDWAYVAAHDTRSEHGDYVEKWVPNFETTPQTDPPLGKPLHLSVIVPSKQAFKVEPGETATLTASLLWCGKKQDSATRGLRAAYQ